MESSYSKDTVELAQGASVSLIGRITGRTLLLLTQISVGRIFGPEAFGLYAIGLIMMRIGGLVALLGLDTGVIRFGARYRSESQERLSWLLLFGIGLPFAVGVIVGVSLILTAPLLASAIFNEPSVEPVIRMFALGIGPLAGLQVAAAATRVSKRVQFSVISEELTQPALALLLTLIVGLLGLGILGAVGAVVLSTGAALIIALYFVRRIYPESFAKGASVRGPWRELLLFSVTVFGSRASIMLMYWIDRLVLGSHRPVAVVGVYQAAAQSAVLFAIILSSFNNIFSPLVADMWHHGDKRRLEAVYRVSTKWGLYLSIPFFVVIWFAPSQVLSAVFGSEYAVGAIALKILAVGQLIRVGTGGVGSLLAITGHHKRWVITATAMLATDLALLLILVPRYGMLGAAIATSATLSFMAVLGLAQVNIILRLWPYDRRYLKGLIAGLGSSLVVITASTIQVSYPLAGLAMVTVASLGAFGAVLMVLGLDDEDKEFIDLVRSRIAYGPEDSSG